MAEKRAVRKPRRSVSEFLASLRGGILEGIAGALALLVTGALAWAWTNLGPVDPPEAQRVAWESQILQDVTMVEESAHKASWREMPGGQLDIWIVGSSVRKLVRHQRYQPAREYFFAGDTLMFAFIRGDENLRFGRAKQGSGHRYFFHPHPRWMAEDSLRMFAWIAPGNARVDTSATQFGVAERELKREAAKLWEIAHNPNWQSRPPVPIRDTGDGAASGPGDEG